MFDIQIENDLSAVETLGWDTLSGGVPFRTADWLIPWFENIGKGHSPAVVTVRRDGRLVGGLPLYRIGGGRTWATMGDGNACTDYTSVLACPDEAPAIGEAIGTFLARTATRSGDAGWDTLRIDGVVGDDPAMTSLMRGLRDAGAGVHASSRLSTWRRPAEADWEAHLKRHSKTRRRKMRRMSERFDGDGEFGRVIADGDDQIRWALDAVIDLHQRRWVGDGEAGSFANPDFRNFVIASTLRMGRSGRLRLVVMTRDGEPIGGDLTFVGDDRVLYCYSAGYDPDHADAEPGRVLMVDMFRAMYGEGYAAVDFMRGDETYKQEYATVSRPVYQIRAFAPSPVNRVRFVAFETAFGLKQLYRTTVGSNPASVATD